MISPMFSQICCDFARTLSKCSEIVLTAAAIPTTRPVIVAIKVRITATINPTAIVAAVFSASQSTPASNNICLNSSKAATNCGQASSTTIVTASSTAALMTSQISTAAFPIVSQSILLMAV